MTLLNQEDIIGNIIPDVFISRITLESSGGVTNKEENPHISHVLENRVIKENSMDSLIVKIDLLINEKISDDVIGSWFDNIEFQKYLKIKIFQCTDNRLTSILSLSNDMLDLIDPEANINEKDLRIKLAGSVLEKEKLEDLRSKIFKETKIKTLNITKNDKIDNFKEIIDSDGNKTKQIFYSVRFDLNNSQLEHLAYFVISGLDIKKIVQDFNIGYDVISFGKENGKVVSEIVIDDFDIVGKSFVFFDPDNKIWSGPIHMLDNGVWRSRSDEEINSVNLRREIVINNKIHDFRRIKEIQKIVFDFFNINARLGQIKMKSSSNDNLNPARSLDYFSDLYISKDRNNDSRIFFSINYKKLILENTIYGRFFKKEDVRFIEEMIRQTKIRQLKLMRRRVKTKTNFQTFDFNEPDEFIALSGEQDYGKFKIYNSFNGSLRELDLVLDDKFVRS